MDTKWIIPELAAQQLNINFSTFRKYLRTGRVAGAERVQGKQKQFWMIPASITLQDIDLPVAGRPSKNKGEFLAQPDKPITKTLAVITVAGGEISVAFPERRDDFGKVVKSLGYKWDAPHWKRTGREGSPVDHAAELGRHLLANRFRVSFPSDAIRQKAISGHYERECLRWVLVVGKGEHKGWFAFEWPRSDDLYNKAMKLASAQYGPPYVVVPPEQYEEVLGFAEVHKFQLSKAAQRLVDRVSAMWEKALTVNIDPNDIDVDEIEERPDEPIGIDDELADEPL